MSFAGMLFIVCLPALGLLASGDRSGAAGWLFGGVLGVTVSRIALFVSGKPMAGERREDR